MIELTMTRLKCSYLLDFGCGLVLCIYNYWELMNMLWRILMNVCALCHFAVNLSFSLMVMGPMHFRPLVLTLVEYPFPCIPYKWAWAPAIGINQKLHQIPVWKKDKNWCKTYSFPCHISQIINRSANVSQIAAVSVTMTNNVHVQLLRLKKHTFIEWKNKNALCQRKCKNVKMQRTECRPIV